MGGEIIVKEEGTGFICYSFIDYYSYMVMMSEYDV